MAKRQFVRTWFLRVLYDKPSHLSNEFALSGGFGIVPIIEYKENGVTTFGLYHRPEPQVFHFSHYDVITSLQPMFLKKPVKEIGEVYCTLFISFYSKPDGTSYTLEEAYLILIEGFFTARTIVEYHNVGFDFVFQEVDKSGLTKFAKNLNEIIEFNTQALNKIRKLTVISLIEDDVSSIDLAVSDCACLIKLRDTVDGYFIGYTESNVLRINWPHFAMRFKDEDSALMYVEKYSYNFRNIGYEIARLPFKAFIPERYPD